MNEGDRCKECTGRMIYPPVENCSCHIAPPCDACVSNPLTCDKCGWVYEAPERSYRATEFEGLSEVITPNRRAIHVFPHGGRIMDYDYDSRSGSTMVWTGKYEGLVTPEDIRQHFGDGTFGHRGPSLHNGRFSYTQITD